MAYEPIKISLQQVISERMHDPFQSERGPGFTLMAHALEVDTSFTHFHAVELREHRIKAAIFSTMHNMDDWNLQPPDHADKRNETPCWSDKDEVRLDVSDRVVGKVNHLAIVRIFLRATCNVQGHRKSEMFVRVLRRVSAAKAQSVNFISERSERINNTLLGNRGSAR
jgi:hypothetical protein